MLEGIEQFISGCLLSWFKMDFSKYLDASLILEIFLMGEFGLFRVLIVCFMVLLMWLRIVLWLGFL